MTATPDTDEVYEHYRDLALSSLRERMDERRRLRRPGSINFQINLEDTLKLASVANICGERVLLKR